MGKGYAAASYQWLGESCTTSYISMAHLLSWASSAAVQSLVVAAEFMDKQHTVASTVC